MKILIKREQRKRVCFAESEKSRTKFKNFALILMSLLMVCCTKNDEAKAQTMTQKLYITIDGQTQAVTLVDNQATKTLVEKLQQAPVTVTLSSSGGFEIWGALGFSLPTSNEQINAQPPAWVRLTVCRKVSFERSSKLAKATSASYCR